MDTGSKRGELMRKLLPSVVGSAAAWLATPPVPPLPLPQAGLFTKSTRAYENASEADEVKELRFLIARAPRALPIS